MRKLLSIALAALLCLGVASAAAAQGQLRVGMECNYAPFNWTQTDDSNGGVAIDGGYAGGYDVEMAKALAEGLGRELVIVKTEWDGLIPALNSGVIDAVIAGMSPTEARKVSVDFTDAYYKSELVVVVRKDGPYAGATALSDFAGAKVTAQLNTVHYAVAGQLAGANLLPAMESFPAMLVALTSGVVDGYVSERPSAESAAAVNPGVSFVSFPEGRGFEASDDEISVAVAVRKGDAELLSGINAILAGIDAEARNQLMAQAMANQPSAE